MSTLGLTTLKTNDTTTNGQDDRAWELLAQVLAGKLSVQAACARGRIPQEDAPEWLRGFHRSALLAYDEQLRQVLIRQGATPEALCGPELILPLSEISIVDWIQAIQLFAKHAVITVMHDGEESRLWCSRGVLIDAESGRLKGEAAVYRIVGLEHGQIVTELRAVRRERTIRTSTQGLLLEAAQRKDEASLLRRRLGNLERHFEARDLGPNRSFNTAETATLRSFATPRRLADVIAQSNVGDVETLAALENLIRTGVLIEARSTGPLRLEGGDPRREPIPRVEASTERRAPQLLGRAPQSLTLPLPVAREKGTSLRNLRWAASTACMAIVVSAAAWFGARAPLSSAAASPLPEPTRASVEHAASYPVMIRVSPAGARLEVDGRAIGDTHYTARFPRDGAQHEIRVSAAGFMPARILFVDTAPPAEVHLEPISAPLPAIPGTPPSAPMAALEVAPVGADAPTVAAAEAPAVAAAAPPPVVAVDAPTVAADAPTVAADALPVAADALPIATAEAPPVAAADAPPPPPPPTFVKTGRSITPAPFAQSPIAPCPSPKCRVPSIRMSSLAASRRGPLPSAPRQPSIVSRPTKMKPNVQIIGSDATTAGRN